MESGADSLRSGLRSEALYDRPIYTEWIDHAYWPGPFDSTDVSWNIFEDTHAITQTIRIDKTNNIAFGHSLNKRGTLGPGCVLKQNGNPVGIIKEANVITDFKDGSVTFVYNVIQGYRISTTTTTLPGAFSS